MQEKKASIGIDIDKENIGIAEHHSGQQWQFANTEEGITQAVLLILKVCPQSWWLLKPQEAWSCLWLPHLLWQASPWQWLTLVR